MSASVSGSVRLFKLLLLQVKVHLYINNCAGTGLLTSSSTLLLPQGRCVSPGRDVEGFGVMWSRCFWVDASALTCHLQNNLQMHRDTHRSFKESRPRKHLFDQNNRFF